MTCRGYLVVTVVLLLFVCGGSASQEDGATSAPSPPEAFSGIAALVGDKQITNRQVDGRLSFPTAQMRSLTSRQCRQRILSELIFQALVAEYAKANAVEPTAADLEEVRTKMAETARTRKLSLEEFMRLAGITQEDLKAQACSRRLLREASTNEKVQAFIREHPDYFNGTTVRALHILIPCPPLAPTNEQRNVLNHLKRIRAEITVGQMAFEDAARRFSACTSKDQGGDLGRFAFPNRPAPLAEAAFRTPVGNLSDIVRTEQGFHLVHVLERTDGRQPPDPNAKEIARQTLLQELQNRIFDQVLTTVPLRIPEEQSTTQPVAPSEQSQPSASQPVTLPIPPGV